MPEGRPSDALATVAVQPKVLFDVVTSNVHFNFKLANSGHRVDKIVGRVVFRPDRFTIADKVELQCVSGATRERRRFALDHVRVLRLLQEERSGRFRSRSAGR